MVFNLKLYIKAMKNKLLPLALALIGSAAFAQVGIGTLEPNASSQLEINATDKGVLIPKVALTSRGDITTITSGNVNSLLVFNTTNNALIKPGFYYWFNDRWEKLSNSTDLEEIEESDLGDISMVVVGDKLVLTDIHGNSTEILLSEINILTGKNGQIDHPIPVQIDHLFRLKLTTQFRSKLTT